MKNVIKALVLVDGYPDDLRQTLMYVHVRNKYYQHHNIDVTVLNFKTNIAYSYDGIKVITEEEYQKKQPRFDILICHAPNLRCHYRFLKKFSDKFNHIILFFHGHEILKISKEYPPEYPWVKKKAPMFLRDVYDNVKFKLWKKEINKILDKTQLVFVSNWLYKKFLENVQISKKILDGKAHIINNSVGHIFEQKKYNKNAPKKYDFVTIRGDSLDGSKYGIDIVYNLAKHNPDMSFLIIGRGKFFKYNKILPNITFISRSLKHQEMLKYLDESRCALLPTKEDTQGVMTCEMATYGIPTITSDIEVCREIFSDTQNVKLIDNDTQDINLQQILAKLISKASKGCIKYLEKNTMIHEVKLIERMILENA